MLLCSQFNRGCVIIVFFFLKNYYITWSTALITVKYVQPTFVERWDAKEYEFSASIILENQEHYWGILAHLNSSLHKYRWRALWSPKVRIHLQGSTSSRHSAAAGSQWRPHHLEFAASLCFYRPWWSSAWWSCAAAATPARAVDVSTSPTYTNLFLRCFDQLDQSMHSACLFQIG